MAKIVKYDEFKDVHTKSMNEKISDPNQEIIDYADKYGMEALAYAIYDIAKTREIEYKWDLVNAVWEYDGNTGE